MEKELFTWEFWDQSDTFVLQFYNCKLLVEIGNWGVNSFMDAIIMDYYKGVMKFYDADSNVIAEFNLKLQITQKD